MFHEGSHVQYFVTETKKPQFKSYVHIKHKGMTVDDRIAVFQATDISLFLMYSSL